MQGWPRFRNYREFTVYIMHTRTYAAGDSDPERA